MPRYVSPDEDSARWAAIRLRRGDIVISTRSKSGTTWMQMICALLVHEQPELPAPLHQLSPWVDHTIEPIEAVAARLDAQQHRRIVKTHTPLDGVPLVPGVHYIVVARHPLDAAVSPFNQGDNIDRLQLFELTGAPPTTTDQRPGQREWLAAWTMQETTPQEQMDSLVGVLHHVRDAWERRSGPADLTLVHYADLQADLEGSMRSVARRLNLDPGDGAWPDLINAATFASMRDHADTLAPNPLGVLLSNQRFFRSGRSGEGTEILSTPQLQAYRARVQSLIPRELFDWLHR